MIIQRDVREVKKILLYNITLYFQGDTTMEIANLIVQIFIAFATIVVAILAIWGDWIRVLFAAPELELKLRDHLGNLTSRANNKRTIYYHLQLINKREWSPAKHVRVLVTGIEKKRPNGRYYPESVISPLQLTWAFPEFHELLPTIATSDVCDLGFLDEDTQQFKLSLYIVPNNWRGYVESGQSMRVSIIASAHNYETKIPLILEIFWDGKWSSNLSEMRKHLVIKDVSKRLNKKPM
jgi:hypothetical protein